jgi:hypothetical protein
MATAKTGSFYLTETVTLPGGSAANTRVSSAIDLGAYVNVATGQAVAVESVDFIIQSGADYIQYLPNFLTGDGSLSYQLADLNTGGKFFRADNQSLIASGAMNIDYSSNQATITSDLYPDNFGPAALSEAFMVVNDALYLTGGNNGSAVGAGDLFITARIKCRVVKLSSKDWMAIAIQSTASDN